MQLGLNLLAALDALLEEGSVAGAAARMHVTLISTGLLGATWAK